MQDVEVCRVSRKRTMLPIRCYTCGKVLAGMTERWELYREKMKNDREDGKEEDWRLFFEDHAIRRYCCKRVLMTQVPDPNHVIQHDLPESVVVSDQDAPTRLFLAR